MYAAYAPSPTLIWPFAGAVTFTAATPRVFADGTSGTCVLRQYEIGDVSPRVADLHYGKVTTRRMVGAEISVVAERGLTAEWLRLHRYRTERHAPAPDCVLDVRGIDVAVESHGPGFMVIVRTTDEDAAKGSPPARKAFRAFATARNPTPLQRDPFSGERGYGFMNPGGLEQ